MTHYIKLITLFTLLLGCENEPSPEHLAQVQSITKQTAQNMVFVEGGSFMMGDSGDGKNIAHFTKYDEEYAVKTITLHSYSINKYETTWGELVTYLKDVGRYEQYEYDRGYRDSPYIAVNDPASPNYYKRAALAPNWYEAEGYCLWLADKTGLPYALPTEAQWEYAARSRGERVRYATQDGMTLVLDDYLFEGDWVWDPVNKSKDTYRYAFDPLAMPKGNAFGTTANLYDRYTRVVGSYPPNKLGIHDMTGNANEWVRDWYEKDHYTKMDELNPQGPAEPKHWQKRYNSDEKIPSKVRRDWVGAASIPGTSIGALYGRGRGAITALDVGFRCALNLDEPIAK